MRPSHKNRPNKAEARREWMALNAAERKVRVAVMHRAGWREVGIALELDMKLEEVSAVLDLPARELDALKVRLWQAGRCVAPSPPVPPVLEVERGVELRSPHAIASSLHDGMRSFYATSGMKRR